MDEEVNAIYSVSSYLVVVCELSVRLLSSEHVEVDRYVANGVLGSSWWQGNDLCVSGDSEQITLMLEAGHLKLL